MHPQPLQFIGGEWRSGRGDSVSRVINPADEAVVSEFKHASQADFADALKAAEAAFRRWRDVSAVDRAAILHRAAQNLRDRGATIARLVTVEQGKPVAEARGEIMGSADVIDWYAEEARRAYGRLIPSRGSIDRHIVQLEPIGVVAAFTPWNVPVMAPSKKIAAAIAAGCTLVIKPCEETPTGAIELARCFADAGLPAGVLNLVLGDPAQISSYLIKSPVVRKMSFTGSVAVGRKLAAMAAEHLKRANIELGGHGPLIVFEDADVDRAAAQAVRAKFVNSGQICIAPSRFFVHEAVHDRFVDRLCELTSGLRVGNGLEDGVTMGPLANSRRLDAMERLVGDATRRGASIKLGGQRVGNHGYFFAPTILTDVPDDADLMVEEPFGPLMPVSRFASTDEVVQRANAVGYGLAGYLYTGSLATARNVGNGLECGMVGINTTGVTFPETPFGGVKDSGYGFKGGEEGLREYCVSKFVAEAA